MKVEFGAPPPVEIPPRDVVITLNSDEAKALQTLLAAITDFGQDRPKAGPINKLVRNLWNALFNLPGQQGNTEIWSGSQPELLRDK